MCEHAPKVAINSNGEELCKDCAVQEELRYMLQNGKTVLYYHRNKVQNWSGDLEFVVYRCKRSVVSVFGRTFTERYDIWFVGPDGKCWHGVNIGDNDLLRCKRTKAWK